MDLIRDMYEPMFSDFISYTRPALVEQVELGIAAHATKYSGFTCDNNTDFYGTAYSTTELKILAKSVSKYTFAVYQLRLIHFLVYARNGALYYPKTFANIVHNVRELRLDEALQILTKEEEEGRTRMRANDIVKQIIKEK